MNPGEAKAILDVLLPLAPNGHVLDTSKLRGFARDAAETIKGFYLLGVVFGACAGPVGYCRSKGCKAHVFVLPEGPDFDGRWIILRPGGVP